LVAWRLPAAAGLQSELVALIKMGGRKIDYSKNAKNEIFHKFS
jgi:hypothetical protein